MTRRLLLLLAVLSTACMLFADDAARGSFDRTLSVSGTPDVYIETGSGSVRVHSGNGASVVIHGDIRARGSDAQQKVQRLQQAPPIEQSGNSIHIGRIGDDTLRQDVSISYDVTVPASTRLESQTGSGAQEILNIKGEVKARAGSGNMHIAGVQNDVTVETGSGAISLEDISGNVRAHAGSGAIRGSNLGPQGGDGRVDVQTGSGSVKLDHIHAALVSRSGSGSVDAGGEPAGTWQLQTGSGGITVRVPASAAFDVSAHAGTGGISIDPAFQLQGTTERHSAQGKVRGGGPMLQLTTGSGGIRVTTGGSGQAL